MACAYRSEVGAPIGICDKRSVSAILAQILGTTQGQAAR
jgi:hypothetical protein